MYNKAFRGEDEKKFKAVLSQQESIEDNCNFKMMETTKAATRQTQAERH